MKKYWLIIVVASSCLFSFGEPALAGRLSDARDFFASRQYPQVVALLEKEINTNPKNAEAHFLLGKCYVAQRKYGAAEERFASAIVINRKYGNEIGKIFKDAANEKLRENDLSEAKRLFDKAVEYQPALSLAAANDCFNLATTYLTFGQLSRVDGLFALAVSYDYTLRKRVSDAYYGLYEQGCLPTNKEVVKLLHRAKEYCDQGACSEKITQLLYKVEDQTLWLGKHRITLQKGEKTAWFSFPYSTLYEVFLPDEEGAFDVNYDDGTTLSFAKGETKPFQEKEKAVIQIVSKENTPQHFIVTVKRK